MDENVLKAITHTIDGHGVRDLKWRPIDNIIVGLVKDPETLNPHLFEGYCSCQWNRYGTPLKHNKGRKDLILPLA